MKEKESRKEARRTKSETDPGEDWEMAPSPLAIGAEWAICQRCSRRTAEKTKAMERMQQQFQVKGGRWAEEIPQRWRKLKGEDRTEMEKEAKLLRCTLLNGTAWSAERKYMRRYGGKCDVFFGMEQGGSGGNGGAVSQGGKGRMEICG